MTRPAPAPLRPRGPLPARTYWLRRVVVLGTALALVVAIASLLGAFGDADGGGDAGGRARTAGTTTSQEPATTPSTTPTDPAAATGKKRGKGKKTSAPPLAEPTGECESSDVVATPVIETAEGGRDVPITINLRTRETAACTWTVSPETLTVTITSGSDFIWSSQQCPTSIAAQDVVVRQAVDAPVVVTWKDAKRSDETCSNLTEWARLGYYHVVAAALAGEPTDVQFELVRPASAVITKTVTPKPKPKKGKGKNRSDASPSQPAPAESVPADEGTPDTEHTPGEQGTGNSAG